MRKLSIASIQSLDGSEVSSEFRTPAALRTPGRPTLDQLAVLAAVVDAGSFSAAARRLHRSQSVISYSIANLEDQLGLVLFTRGRRQLALTDAGRAVLADARRIDRAVADLRARASGLSGGLEAEVALAVDVLFPIERLVAVLDAFAQAFPTVSLRLHVEALGAVVELVLDRSCTLGIGTWVALLHEGLDSDPLADIVMVAVAAPHHPLARLRAPIPVAAVRDETQLVLSDRSQLTAGQDFGVLSDRCWRLGDLGAKLALLRAGLGWGNMPESMVERDLHEGRLVRLPIEGKSTRRLQPLLIHRADTALRPAARWLAARLREGEAGPAGGSGGERPTPPSR